MFGPGLETLRRGAAVGGGSGNGRLVDCKGERVCHSSLLRIRNTVSSKPTLSKDGSSLQPVQASVQVSGKSSHSDSLPNIAGIINLCPVGRPPLLDGCQDPRQAERELNIHLRDQCHGQRRLVRLTLLETDSPYSDPSLTSKLCSR